MAPGRQYHNISYSNGEIIASSSTEADTRATSTNHSRRCKCCGQETERCTNLVFISTPTKEESYFEKMKNSQRKQPQDINKTHHWKQKNKP